MSLFALGLALLAGLLTIMSPCVLPLTPILATSALSQNRFGPAALAFGLALSFSMLGLAIAAFGLSLNLDAELIRKIGAGLMVAIGLILLVPLLQETASSTLMPLSRWMDERSSGFQGRGIAGQFALGALLGMVWSPCVGPTLGAATALASQGKDLVAATMVMGMFGFGAAAGLLAIAYGARSLLARRRGLIQSLASQGKGFLGGLLVIFGMLVLTGFDRLLEGQLVQVSPLWLTNLTTRF